MWWKRVIVIVILGLVALAGPELFGGGAAGNEAAWAAEFETSPLTVVTPRGHFSFIVELAVTPAQRRQGLQHRHFMAADHGMLFDFGRDEPVSMWMINTPIALDMVFIDAAGRVSHVAENTTPYSLDLISSTGPVRAVLEVTAGTAERLGIDKGSHIQHPLFESR